MKYLLFSLSLMFITSIIFFTSILIIFIRKSRRYKFIIKNTNDLYYLYNKTNKNKLLYISDSSIDFCGYSTKEFYADTYVFSKLVHPEDYPLYEYIKEYSTQIMSPVIMRWITKDNKIIWVEHREKLILTQNGKERILGHVRNITHQKNEEFFLRENNKMYRELFNNATDNIFIYKYTEDRLAGKIINVNQIAENTFEYGIEEFLKMKYKDIIDKKYYEIIKDKLKNLDENHSVTYDASFISKSDKYYDMEINSTVFEYKDVKVIMSIARDVTLRKRMEHEVIKNQKYESLSILSASIAHDFNNFLSGILSCTNAAGFCLDNKEELQNTLHDIEKEIVKATGLTKQLLTFSKNEMPKKKVIEIKNLLNEIAEFCLRGSNIEYTINVSPDLWNIEADLTQMNQVFSNLVINARQAMSKQGGKLEIFAENRVMKEKEKLIFEPGNYVKIKIKDNGKGISKEDINKIFDPFFTTKKDGNGLGLAVVYSIIKKHDGNIFIESKEKKGTKFCIYLPASKSTADFIPNSKIEKGSGRVLILDDQEVIRKSISKMLSIIGYDVDQASTGELAIKKYKKSLKIDKKYDIVVLDLTVPGSIGGKDVLNELIKVDPDVCAVISSGYTNDKVVSDYSKYGFKDVILKPYTIERLSDVLNKLKECR